MPAGGLWVLKRIPLARNRIALGKSDDETDNGEDVQSDAESQDGHPQPRLWAEDADDQDANAQLWQGDTEKSPRIDEDDPKGRGWDGVDQVGVSDLSGGVKGLLECGHSDNVEYLFGDDGAVSISYSRASVLWRRCRYPRNGDNQVVPAECISLQAKA